MSDPAFGMDVFEALTALAETDFRIIKEVERLLLAAGELDPELARKREGWRGVIRRSRGEVT